MFEIESLILYRNRASYVHVFLRKVQAAANKVQQSLLKLYKIVYKQ